MEPSEKGQKPENDSQTISLRKPNGEVETFDLGIAYTLSPKGCEHDFEPELDDPNEPGVSIVCSKCHWGMIIKKS